MPNINLHTRRIDWAAEVMNHEASSIKQTVKSLDENFSKAIDILLVEKGKIIVTGIGKSGHLGKRVAATLCSTGTSAAFLHPAEAVHGDLGIHQAGDPVIFLSNSGSTPELLFLEPIFRTRGSKIVGMLGKIPSKLSSKMDVALDVSVVNEADPLGIVPTSSCSVAAAMADAIASVLMKEKNFTKTDYALTHPAGQLGRNLLLKVSDVMHDRNCVAIVNQESDFNKLILTMTNFPLGAACVEDGDKLIGIITDGDIRRNLQRTNKLDEINVKEIMNKNFTVANPEMSLGDALKLMEERQSAISVLPVVDSASSKLLGMIRLHDIYS